MKRRILVVDIGGSFVKLLMSERVEREFASGPRMTPKQFLAKFKDTVSGWKFDVGVDWFSGACTRRTNSSKPEALG
jgi:hypothetical protein